MAATKSALTIIARGTPGAAFTQVAASSLTVRNGTSAFFHCSTAALATIASADYCLFQGANLEEYNGVFQIDGRGTATAYYTIKQDPGANASTNTGCVMDKVVYGTPANLSASYGASFSIGIQNAGTGPTVGAQVWRGISVSSAITDYQWKPLLTASVAAQGLTTAVDNIDSAVMYINYVVCRNTAQPVDCYIIGSQMTAG